MLTGSIPDKPDFLVKGHSMRPDQPNYNPLHDLNSPLHPLNPLSINPASPYYQKRLANQENRPSDNTMEKNDYIVSFVIIVLFVLISIMGFISSINRKKL